MTTTAPLPLSPEDVDEIRAALRDGGYCMSMTAERFLATIDHWKARAESAEKERDEQAALLVHWLRKYRGLLNDWAMADTDKENARARAEQAEAALRPFAKEAAGWDGHRDTISVWTVYGSPTKCSFTVGDLRKAAAVLEARASSDTASIPMLTAAQEEK